MSVITRPPVIAIMGHVDHGKTSLLDAIRKSNVADREAGGITQHIGAYQIDYNNRKLTFLDTPGHAAFSKMRSRGAQVTDIVILVVAADDGVKPQTIESIQHIKASGVEYIVAINKIDAPGANVLNVKSQLAEHEVFLEGFGGNVSAVEVSAKTKQGLNELLDLILLTADVADLHADTTAPFQAVVIESGKDSKRGSYATLLVQQGTLEVRQTIFFGQTQERIRGMVDANGKTVLKAEPSQPVLVQGLSQVPIVGSLATAAMVDQVVSPSHVQVIEDTNELKLRVILKSDVEGSMEALKVSLPTAVEVLASSVGEITESDVLLAQTMKAKIIGFNIKASKSVEELAVTHAVKIKTYRIIYELLEDLEKQVFAMQNPHMNEEIVGTAEIIAQFEMRGEKIAGCKVLTGEIKRGQNILYHLKRGDEELPDPRIKSMKQGKVDVDSVKAGGECGIVFRQGTSFKIGDVITCYMFKEI